MTMSTAETTIADEPAAATPFCKALRWRVHGREEALSIAVTHRGRAADARSGIPDVIDNFLDRCKAASLEQRACRHDEIAAVCERHAARLRARAHTQAKPQPV
jgi:hypothetical protein